MYGILGHQTLLGKSRKGVRVLSSNSASFFYILSISCVQDRIERSNQVEIRGFTSVILSTN